MSDDLSNQHCSDSEQIKTALNAEQIKSLISQLNQWKTTADNQMIKKNFLSKIFTKLWIC